MEMPFISFQIWKSFNSNMGRN